MSGYLNTIGSLIARKRQLEKYLRHETNVAIKNDLDNEIKEVESAIEILRQANGVNSENANCDIFDVSQQRELLLAFMQTREGHAVDTVDIHLIDAFLESRRQ